MNDERLGLPSASGAKRFRNCAVSHRLQALAPTPTDHPEDPLAAEGSLIHEAFELDDGSELTMNQAEILAKLKEIDQDLYKQWRIDFPVQDKGFEMKEERWFVFGPDGKPTGSAKPDHVYVIGNCALCTDLKTGWIEVEDASSNMQGRLQALALIANNPEVEHVRVAFVQFRFKKFYTFCDYTAEDLSYALFEWNAAVWQSKQPDAIANPGEWCKGCKAQSYCKAAACWSLLPSVNVNGGALMTTEEKKNIPALVEQMSIEDLRDVHDRHGIIKDTMEAIKDRLKRLPEETLKALGYEKRPGVKYITKTDINPLFQLLWTQGIWDHIEESKRLDEATKQFSECTTALTGEVNKLVVPILVGRKGYKTKKAAEEKVKELLAQVSTFGVKESTLKKLKE